MEKHSDFEHRTEDRILSLLSEPLAVGQFENIKEDMAANISIRDIAGGQFITVNAKNVDEETTTYLTVYRLAETKQVLSFSAMQIVSPDNKNIVYLYYPGSETARDLINISNLNMLVELIVESQTRAKEI